MCLAFLKNFSSWFLEREEGERELYAFIGCFLYVPWPWIEPATLEYQTTKHEANLSIHTYIQISGICHRCSIRDKIDFLKDKNVLYFSPYWKYLCLYLWKQSVSWIMWKYPEVHTMQSENDLAILPPIIFSFNCWVTDWS